MPRSARRETNPDQKQQNGNQHIDEKRKERGKDSASLSHIFQASEA